MLPPNVATLPPGPTSRTAEIIVDLARAGRMKYPIRLVAEDITKRVAHRDQLSEVLAVYHWVCRNIRYVSDPHDVELVKDPENVLATRAGDCDDMVCLIAALCMCLGRPVRVVTAGFGRMSPHHTHTWLEVNVGDRWIALDPVAGARTPSMLRRVTTATPFYA